MIKDNSFSSVVYFSDVNLFGDLSSDSQKKERRLYGPVQGTQLTGDGTLTGYDKSPLYLESKQPPGVLKCLVTKWSPWSECSVTCGRGHKQKTRYITVIIYENQMIIILKIRIIFRQSPAPQLFSSDNYTLSPYAAISVVSSRDTTTITAPSILLISEASCERRQAVPEQITEAKNMPEAPLPERRGGQRERRKQGLNAHMGTG